MPAAVMLSGVEKIRHQAEVDSRPAFSYCLNTSTIRGQNQGILKDVETAARAGYDGIEIWINAVDAFVEGGGTLKDLASYISDQGLRVENAIGFAQWIVDDAVVRKSALEQLKREMDMLAQLGCRRVAAPPAGATSEPMLDLDLVAERFRATVELGVAQGVVPQLEIWGFSKNLHRLSQVLYVAAECGHPQTRILPDIYHLYKGDSDFNALKLMSASSIEIFHVNDYPGDPPRDTINDSHRVYPGDGVAPVADVLRDLHHHGSTTVLSLELFNQRYWEEDALRVAETGLRKMKEAVARLGL